MRGYGVLTANTLTSHETNNKNNKIKLYIRSITLEKYFKIAMKNVLKVFQKHRKNVTA